MGAKTLGGITKVIKSYEGDQFSKISFKGRGQPYFTVLSPKSPDPPPSPFPQAINNDWSLTETFPRSMINKLLPQEPIRAHFLSIYHGNNLSGILEEHHLQAFMISCSPNIPSGFFRRLTNRKLSLFLVYTQFFQAKNMVYYHVIMIKLCLRYSLTVQGRIITPKQRF